MPSSAEELLLKITGDATGGEKAVNDIEAAVQKTVKALSGDGLYGSANKVTAAIQQLGGVTKLTAEEQARATTTIDKAIEKYKVMGQTAPPAMVALRQELGRLEPPANAARTALTDLSGAIGGMLTAGALIGFGREILNAGDHIQKMADQTDESTENVQRLMYIAGQSGSSVESLVGAIQNLQQRLGTDDAGAVGAMKKLGINMDAFNKLGAYDQMTLLGTAVKDIQNPTDQAATAAALFGKTWKEILPAIKSGMKETGDQATVMADDTVKSLDRIGDTLTAAKGQAIAWGGSLVLGIEKAGFAFGDFLSRFDPEHLGVSNSELLKLVSSLNDQDGLAGALSKVKQPVLDVGAGVKNLGLQSKDAKVLEDALTESARAAIDVNKKHEEAVRKAAEATDKWRASVTALSFKAFIEDTNKLNAQVPDLSDHMADMANRFADVRAHMDDLESSGIELNRIETETGAIIGGTVIPMFSKLATGATPQMTKALLDATTASATLGDTLKNNLSKSLGGLNDVFQKAFEGGGGVKGAVQSFATNALSGVLSAIPAIGPVLSQFSGAFVAGFKKLFSGPSQAELEGRKIEAAFEQSFGSFQKMADAIGATYEATGRGAAAAQADIQALMAAEKQGGAATQAMVDKINGAFEQQKKVIAENNTALGGLLKSGQDLGIKLPPALQDSIQKLIDMGKVTGDNASLFASLSGSSEVDFKKISEIAQRAGADLKDLGPKFEGARLHDLAGGVINDFDTLQRGLDDTDEALRIMKKPINDLVNESIKFGVDIPANMRPWVEQLERTGQLTDENGNKLTDLSGLQFGEPVKTEFQKIIDKLSELIDKIANPLSSAINNIPRQADAAANATNTATRRMVDDWNDVKWAVDGVATGHSPDGIKQITVETLKASAAISDFSSKAVQDFNALAGGVDGVLNRLADLAKSPVQGLSAAAKAAMQAGDDASSVALNRAAVDAANGKSSTLTADQIHFMAATAFQSAKGRAATEADLIEMATRAGYTQGTSLTVEQYGASLNKIIQSMSIPMAGGGIGRVTRPTLFLAGEKPGGEDVAFSGVGKSFRGGGVTVNVTVEGNVWAERDLADAIKDRIKGDLNMVKQFNLRGQ